MAENSKIEWCRHTFNPWIGCTKVSPGCANCYAEALMDHRYGKAEWGPNGSRNRTSPSNWAKPLRWNRAAEAAGERHRVFCASLADVFERNRFLPDQWRADLFGLIRRCQSLDWLLLTKRPQNVPAMLADVSDRLGVPVDELLRNVWLGTSVEDQTWADVRIPHLLAVPAAVRFLSCEPLLGPLDLASALRKCRIDEVSYRDVCTGLHWVIVGGESGPKARPCRVEWLLDLKDECAAAGVPFFCKQLGSNAEAWMPELRRPGHGPFLSNTLRDKKGGDWDEWPEQLSELRVREFPSPKVAV